jgi:hypothetical protein
VRRVTPATHRWTDRFGQEWECDAYDHGPFCRLCRPGEWASPPVSSPGDDAEDADFTYDEDAYWRSVGATGTNGGGL